MWSIWKSLRILERVERWAFGVERDARPTLSAGRPNLALPALGLHVVHVKVLADLDGSDGAADVDAVLDHRRVFVQRLDGQLVADGNVVQGFHGDGLVFFHHPAG